MDGSAIHNRLKYLGVLDKPISSSNKINVNKIYPKNIDTEYKTQDTRYKYLVFDDHMGIRQQKRKSNLIMNDPYLSSNLSNYSSNYKPQTHDFSSTMYDDHNSSYYTPMNFKKYGKTINYQTPYPQEYEVYYFPTSKPITQYPRQTTERFYRRKPMKQYPEEEVPYWHTRYPKPVRVVEREPYYPMIDHGYYTPNDFHINRKNFETYSPQYRTRHIPTNDDMDHGYSDSSGYYYERDLGHPSISSITRPCSPVYSRNTEYNKTLLKNPSSLLEKKIRDYVWNPYKERAEKYTGPDYEKSTYYTDFKPLLRSRYKGDEILQTHTSSDIDSRLRNRKNEITKENSHVNQITTSPEKRFSNNFQTRNDDSSFSEFTPYKNRSETTVHFPKRISFDLDDENNDELPNHKNSIRENIDENSITKERKSNLGIRESNAKLNDKRRSSILLNDDYSVSTSQPHILQSVTNENFRRGSSSKQGKLASTGNSFESDKLIASKNYAQRNDFNKFEKNEHIDSNDTEKVVYDRNKDNQFYPKMGNEKNNDMLEDKSNGNENRSIRHDSNDSSLEKLNGTTEKSSFRNKDLAENISNHKDNFNATKRRESYKNESKLKKENISETKIKPINNINNQLEKEYNDYQNGSNESFKNTIGPFKDDFENDNNHIRKYNINKEETNHDQQINIDNYVKNENNSETFIPHQNIDDSNTETNTLNSIKRNSSDFETIPKQQEVSKEILIDKDIKQHSIDEYEIQPENVDEHNMSNVENNIYSDKRTDNNKEHVTNNHPEPIQSNELIDKSDVHDELYYKNPTDNINEKNPIENQYENPEDSQKNYVDKEPVNDDYYYQNYSNGDSKEPPENNYAEPDHQEPYTNEQNEHEDYYYQNHTVDETKEQHENPPYVDPNYQSNYENQQQHNNDDYYYQNYSNAEQKEQSKEQYAEPSHQEEYITEQNIEHDDYYYQNQPKETVNENQIDQHYTEPEHQENYVKGEQDNYYYENNPALTTERTPPSQYDENTQQENYADNQHDDYYYQKHDDNNYNESVPQEQYDGYVGDQHEANGSYYPESHDNNYEPQQNYENDNYQTEQSNYTTEQNPNNAN